jgi:hypothetical protein
MSEGYKQVGNQGVGAAQHRLHLTAFPTLCSGMLRDRRGDAAAIWQKK